MAKPLQLALTVPVAGDDALVPFPLCLPLHFAQGPDPLQQLTATGSSCKLFRGAEAHAANEAGDNLVPWNGDSSNMIDRYRAHTP